MPATTPAKSADKAPMDHLQDALEDLDKAREQAGEEVSAKIDSARDRINEAREDMSHRGHDQLTEWREQLESAADGALEEFGRWAIRAQRKPQALGELSKEITKRKAEVGA
jgi:uncharacterized protein YicC (UPF0701 family)